ncbi:MAG: hypothetical protein K6E75_05860 [Lachnospiraceae bacterium]|nr:hypothetical protein [Lachnospiraceae bacterium]
MRRKGSSKRLAALLITAALAVTETIGAFGAMPAAGEDTLAVEEEFAAPQVMEDAAQAGEEAEGESISANTAVSVEEETAFEEELEEQDKNRGTNGVPAAVTGINIVKDSDTMKALGISEPQIRWNYVPGCYLYEFQVKDAMGYVYADGTWTNAAGTKEYYYPTFTSSDDRKLPTRSLSEIGGSAYQNGELIKQGDDTISPFKLGQTYTISIRAVNKYAEEITQDAYRAGWTGPEVDYVDYERKTEKDENNNNVTKYYKVTTFNGPWSAPITYKAEFAGITPPVVLSGLAATSQDDDYVYFTYAQSFQGGRVRYQYSTDNTFTNYRSSSSSQGGIYNTDKMYIYKGNLTAGTTYYVRAWYVNEEGDYIKDAKGTPVYSNVASFIPAPKENVIANVTPALSGLRLVKTTASAFYFAIGTVLEDEKIQYQLEYSDDPNFADYDYATNMSIKKSWLDVGKIYYVRMRTVNYDVDPVVYGTPSNIVTIQRAISGGTISLLEQNSDGLVIGYPTEMNKADRIEYWVSTDAAFQNKPLATGVYTANTTESDRLTIGYGAIEPGQTVYIRMRCGISLAYIDYNGLKGETYDYGSYTNTLKVKIGLKETELYTDTVTASSIRIGFSTDGGGLYTGWELQKKNGNVWDELTKTTAASYTDKKLKSDTEYVYRARTYYYNSGTGKTTYGNWKTMTTMTWGGNLHLVGMAKSKTSAKLTWNKIKGASGYEVYRMVTYSEGYTNYSAKKGAVENYSKYVLLGSTKKASYTAKKLNAGSVESFLVRAYKNVKGKKYYIESYTNVCLDFDMLHIVSTQLTKKGAKKVTWNPVYSASGYVVERLDTIKDEWVTFKTINKAKASSVTLPASPNAATTYRIRAFRKGTPKKYTDPDTNITVNPFLNAPSSVKAKALGDGSVQVTWKAVPGATYYKVYRTTNPAYTYNTDTKQYNMAGGTALSLYIPDASSKTGYREETDPEKLTANIFVDRRLTYTANGIEATINGPEPGMTYYYYVVAYKKMTFNSSTVNYKDDDMVVSMDSKPAKVSVGSNKEAKSLKAPKISKISSKKKKVTLSWKAVAGAESYVIYRSVKKKKGYVVVGYAENGKTAFTDTNAIKGKTYYYKVKAAVKNDYGLDVTGKSFSKVKQIKVK